MDISKIISLFDNLFTFLAVREENDKVFDKEARTIIEKAKASKKTEKAETHKARHDVKQLKKQLIKEAVQAGYTGVFRVKRYLKDKRKGKLKNSLP